MNKVKVKKAGIFIMMVIMIFSMMSSFSFAESSKPEGYIYLTVEKATIGQGYLVEPSKVPFYKGENLGDVVIRFFEEEGIEAKCGIEKYNQFYLEKINDVNGNVNADFPQYIKALKTGADNSRKSLWLGEFDYINTSGWVLKVNNVHSKTGAGKIKPQNNDVVRFAFTITGQGADCWNTGTGLCYVPEDTNRDYFIKKIAEFNLRQDKNQLLETDSVKKAYKGLMDTANDYTVSQSNINRQIEDFESSIAKGKKDIKLNGEAKVVDEKIKAIGKVTLYSEKIIKEAEEAYNNFADKTEDADERLENEQILYDAVNKFEKLYSDAEKEGIKIKNEIEYLGDATLNNCHKIINLSKEYEIFAKDNPYAGILVDNYSNLEKLLPESTELMEEAIKMAADTDNIINEIGEVTSDKYDKIKKARESYDMLPESAKAEVKNLNVLEAAEAEYEKLNKRENEKNKNVIAIESNKDVNSITTKDEMRNEESKIKETPVTGDNSDIYLWIVIALSGVLTLIISGLYERKNNKY